MKYAQIFVAVPSFCGTAAGVALVLHALRGTADLIPSLGDFGEAWYLQMPVVAAVCAASLTTTTLAVLQELRPNSITGRERWVSCLHAAVALTGIMQVLLSYGICLLGVVLQLLSVICSAGATEDAQTGLPDKDGPVKLAAELFVKLAGQGQTGDFVADVAIESYCASHGQQYASSHSVRLILGSVMAAWCQTAILVCLTMSRNRGISSKQLDISSSPPTDGTKDGSDLSGAGELRAFTSQHSSDALLPGKMIVERSESSISASTTADERPSPPSQPRPVVPSAETPASSSTSAARQHARHTPSSASRASSATGSQVVSDKSRRRRSQGSVASASSIRSDVMEGDERRQRTRSESVRRSTRTKDKGKPLQEETDLESQRSVSGSISSMAPSIRRSSRRRHEVQQLEHDTRLTHGQDVSSGLRHSAAVVTSRPPESSLRLDMPVKQASNHALLGAERSNPLSGSSQQPPGASLAQLTKDLESLQASLDQTRKTLSCTHPAVATSTTDLPTSRSSTTASSSSTAAVTRITSAGGYKRRSRVLAEAKMNASQNPGPMANHGELRRANDDLERSAIVCSSLNRSERTIVRRSSRDTRPVDTDQGREQHAEHAVTPERASASEPARPRRTLSSGRQLRPSAGDASDLGPDRRMRRSSHNSESTIGQLPASAPLDRESTRGTVMV